MATNKKIRISYEGKDYVLEFSKHTVRAMQEQGFDVSRYDTAPNVVIPDLFAGAFRKNHPFIKRDVVEGIYNGLRNKSDLITNLMEMYNEPALGLFDEPEDETKNVEWTVD